VRVSRVPARTSAAFDDPNPLSHGDLMPGMTRTERAGRLDLLAEHVRPGGERGVNAAHKVSCLVDSMAAAARQEYLQAPGGYWSLRTHAPLTVTRRRHPRQPKCALASGIQRTLRVSRIAVFAWPCAGVLSVARLPGG
jgi:hypothetical protein